MAISSQNSPGINIREIDLTNYVSVVSVSTGGFVGQFNWGPADFPVMVATKENLKTRFLPPTDSSLNGFAATCYMSCLNFLSYAGGSLWVVRAIDIDSALNSSSANVYYTNAGQLTPSQDLEANTLEPKVYLVVDANVASNLTIGWYLTGNNVNTLQIIDANTESGLLSLSGEITANVSTTDRFEIEILNSANTEIIKNEIDYEDRFLHQKNNNKFGPFVARYPGVAGDSLTISVCTSSNNFSTWNYRSYFPNPPRTSESAALKGSANDEMHIVVVDTNGIFSGQKGQVLEKFELVSKAFDAIDASGRMSYYKQVIFERSNYIYAMDPVDYANTADTWERSVKEGIEFDQTPNMYFKLDNGSNGNDLDSSDLIRGWDEFKNKDAFEVNLCITGASSIDVCQYLIDNIIEGQNYPITGRKDAMVFISPRYQDVVSAKGQELTNIIGVGGFLDTLDRQSSYAVVDSGWKYQLDPYNNIYRWVPLNADIAGLCAQTDLTHDTWVSPAGMRKGLIKNILKLAWNPLRNDRDYLYMNGVNPVVSFTGTGPMLFGDKTLLSTPSAFDRINVRRLFITLEKSISMAALNSLFEMNDQFTRSQFVAMVEPYLRAIKAKNGIYDYLVVCDATNNTPQVIDSNGFVGDIYIKPTKSINFIQLNFVAVKSGVEFSTVVGKF
jgi:hypothetical protein